MCTEAGDQRSRLQAAAALNSRTAAEQRQSETADLRRQLGCARDDVALLQKQLADAGDRQAALVVELRRMSQQLSSGQMELEASRAIASAQRETILVREAETARLEARLGLVQRSLQQSSVQHADDGSVNPGGTTASLLPEVDLATASVATCPPLPAEMASVGIKRRDAGSTEVDAALSASVSHVDDGDHHVSDNPDSLMAMWQQLQLNDSACQSASGSSITSTRVPDLHSTANPPGTTSTRLSSALDEKARVQSRIKALIGYREPVKKSSAAAAKPRMSVRPQPPSHSKSSAVSTSVKQPRRASASDSANSSQLSSAVSHYNTSSVDHLATN